MHQNIGATFELNGDNGYCKSSYKFLPSKPSVVDKGESVLTNVGST